MLQNGFKVDVIKTNVIDVDDSSHALPPYLSKYAEYNVSEFFCPDEWSKDGIFIPVKEGDALWFDLRRNEDCAVLPSVQRVNPVTGEPSNLEGGLSKDPVQNYMVLPQQQWIDGYAKNGKVYQFRITKAGEGLAVNEFVLPKNMQDSHAVGFAFYGLKNPKPKIDNSDPWACSSLYDEEMFKVHKKYYSKPIWISQKGTVLRSCTLGSVYNSDTQISSANMVSDSPKVIGASAVSQDFIEESGLNTVENSMNCFCESTIEDRLENSISFDKASMGAGGRIVQSIVSDNNSIDYYKEKPCALLIIYFCLPEQFESIMKKGRRNDSSKKDKFVFSGEIGGVQVPLIK